MFALGWVGGGGGGGGVNIYHICSFCSIVGGGTGANTGMSAPDGPCVRHSVLLLTLKCKHSDQAALELPLSHTNSVKSALELPLVHTCSEQGLS